MKLRVEFEAQEHKNLAHEVIEYDLTTVSGVLNLVRAVEWAGITHRKFVFNQPEENGDIGDHVIASFTCLG